MIKKTRKECIDCGMCTKQCTFLSKYDINLKDFTYKEDIRFECFMCDNCKDVCPKDLSGSQICRQLKEKDIKNEKKLKFMKNPYLFKNTSDKKSEKLLYFGCNYPGYYPKTCEKLIEICKEYNIDFSVDCCQKPIYDNGSEVDYTNMQINLEKKGVKTIICVCPNCYHTFKKTSNFDVISIFEFLYKNNIGKKIDTKANVYFPCSDRHTLEIFEYIKKYLVDYNSPYESINCCGLGGGVIQQNKQIAMQISKQFEHIMKDKVQNIYTYCSSCSGQFAKYKLNNIKNILSEILDVNEAVSSNYAVNIIKYKFLNRR